MWSILKCRRSEEGMDVGRPGEIRPHGVAKLTGELPVGPAAVGQVEVPHHDKGQTLRDLTTARRVAIS